MKSQTKLSKIPGEKDDLENLMFQDEDSKVGAKKNPLSKKEKHKREVQSLTLMDSILDQIDQFTAKEKIADFAKVS